MFHANAMLIFSAKIGVSSGVTSFLLIIVTIKGVGSVKKGNFLA